MSKLSPTTVYFFILCSIILVFLLLPFSGNKGIIFGSDVITFFYPLRDFTFQSLKAGTIPLWNPYIYSGTPNLAGLQSAIFYPMNIIYILFTTASAYNISTILHVVLMGVFMLFSCRKLSISIPGSFIAGIIYALNGYTLSHIYAGHVTPLCAMAWFPLLLLSAVQLLQNGRIKWILWVSIFVALGFLAGHPQYFYYLLVAMVLLFFFRWSRFFYVERDCLSVL